MTTRKLCLYCNHAVEFGEVHSFGCAYCSNLMEGESDYIPLSRIGFDNLPDYIDPDIEANKPPIMSEINPFDGEER